MVVEQFTSIIHHNRDKHIPTKKTVQRSQISQFNKQLFTLKNTIQRQCNRSRCPIEKRKLKNVVNKYQKKISELIVAILLFVQRI